jgi:hypothetical protein
MHRILKQGCAIGELDDVTEVHDRDPIRNMLNNQEVVSNKEIGELQFALKLFEGIENLSLDRNVEGGDRFIANNEFRIEGEGAGDADALTLTTAEFVGVTGGVFGAEADRLHQFDDPGVALL